MRNDSDGDCEKKNDRKDLFGVVGMNNPPVVCTGASTAYARRI